MRAELHLTLASGSSAILREITPLVMVRALSQLLDSGDKAIKEVATTDWDNVLLSHSDLIQVNGTRFTDTKLAITEADNAFISERFIALNHAIYQPKSQANVQSAFNGTRKLSVFHKELNHSCAALIQLGHRDVWNYGWYFYTVAQEINKKD